MNRDISILLNAKTANRPLLRGGREAVLKLYAERIETYRKCADLIVNRTAPAASEEFSIIIKE